jgi:hypothetical protein
MFEFFKIKIDQKHFEISVQKYLISNGTESTWGRIDLGRNDLGRIDLGSERPETHFSYTFMRFPPQYQY